MKNWNNYIFPLHSVKLKIMCNKTPSQSTLSPVCAVLLYCSLFFCFRGSKHHKNKAKYNDKSKIDPKPSGSKVEVQAALDVDHKLGDQSYSKRPITSNWDRYEDVSNNSNQNKKTDFALLVQAPVSHGGHFQFKSDKLLASEINNSSFQSNNLFSLDLERLGCGLNTIPFYLRCGLPKDIFTVSFQTQ